MCEIIKRRDLRENCAGFYRGKMLCIFLIFAIVRVRIVILQLEVDMHMTSKGQVTIPKKMRELFGLFPLTEVEFEAVEDGLLIKKAKSSKSFGKKVVEHMRGRSDAKMTTDEIMALTRG
jgi:antitoxin PrlF